MANLADLAPTYLHVLKLTAHPPQTRPFQKIKSHLPTHQFFRNLPTSGPHFHPQKKSKPFRHPNFAYRHQESQRGPDPPSISRISNLKKKTPPMSESVWKKMSPTFFRKSCVNGVEKKD